MFVALSATVVALSASLLAVTPAAAAKSCHATEFLRGVHRNDLDHVHSCLNDPVVRRRLCKITKAMFPNRAFKLWKSTCDAFSPSYPQEDVDAEYNSSDLPPQPPPAPPPPQQNRPITVSDITDPMYIAITKDIENFCPPLELDLNLCFKAGFNNARSVVSLMDPIRVPFTSTGGGSKIFGFSWQPQYAIVQGLSTYTIESVETQNVNDSRKNALQLSSIWTSPIWRLALQVIYRMTARNGTISYTLPATILLTLPEIRMELQSQVWGRQENETVARFLSEDQRFNLTFNARNAPLDIEFAPQWVEQLDLKALNYLILHHFKHDLWFTLWREIQTTIANRVQAIINGDVVPNIIEFLLQQAAPPPTPPPPTPASPPPASPPRPTLSIGAPPRDHPTLGGERVEPPAFGAGSSPTNVSPRTPRSAGSGPNHNSGQPVPSGSGPVNTGSTPGPGGQPPAVPVPVAPVPAASPSMPPAPEKLSALRFGRSHYRYP